MAGKTYRLRIAHGEHQFEAEGDKAFVLEMLKRFESSDAPTQVHTGKSGGDKPAKQDVSRDTSAGGKALSVGEFIRQLGFKKHTDIVLAFGYYLERNMGLQNFTPADINNCYYEAKMESSNTSQMCISNIRRGFMMEAKGTKKGGRKRYVLTRSGEDHVKGKSTKQTE